jgi:hypothetical protein
VSLQAPAGRKKPAAARGPERRSCKSNVYWVVCPPRRLSAVAGPDRCGVRMDITFTGFARLASPSPVGADCAPATSARAWKAKDRIPHIPFFCSQPSAPAGRLKGVQSPLAGLRTQQRKKQIYTCVAMFPGLAAGARAQSARRAFTRSDGPVVLQPVPLGVHLRNLRTIRRCLSVQSVPRGSNITRTIRLRLRLRRDKSAIRNPQSAIGPPRGHGVQKRSQNPLPLMGSKRHSTPH